VLRAQAVNQHGATLTSLTDLLYEVYENVETSMRLFVKKVEQK